ncbi:MAG: type IV secretory system conjugative DNA transfer family protein [bacterium]|nr:type IV secretory system conjugative DNA transfer family protein [bacterium]MDY2830356.1 type IV secretory system conjugative DNA transfer family protein [Alphaproteobacteria bacterium]
MALEKEGEEWKEYNSAVRWMVITVLLSVLITVFLALVSMPLAYLIGNGISKDSIDDISKFFSLTFNRSGFLYNRYWIWLKQLFNYSGPFSLSLWIPILPFISLPIGLLVGIITNPYRFQSNIHGSARLADLKDIKKMGLLDGFCIVVGKFKGHLLRMGETLSVLCCAPPGTGKTVGVVIPTLFNSPTMSVVVNDPKPELCFSTSGARAKVGPVFIINWGMEDNPAEGIYYPSWNPLSPNAIPAPGPARDMYVDSMCNVLVEDPKGGADPHWSTTGRAALTGFIHFIVSKCEKARANDYFIGRFFEGTLDDEDKKVLEGYYLEMNDPMASRALQNLRANTLNIDNYLPIGTWALLPEKWIGREACIAMILEWITEAQIKQSQDIKRRMDEGDQMAAMADPMRDLLEAAIDEARKFGYSPRCVVELSQLSSMPDKERGSVMSTAFAGIGIFKNSAVVSRTSFSDISFKDLRGLKDPITGEFKPISVYLSVNQVDARALSVISGTFIDLMSSYLIANPPNFVNATDGKMGPFACLFALDEFPTMPKLKAVIDGPAVGRGQKVSYLLIGQDLGQISGKYGKDDLETVISTTACKVILSQNNEVTAQRFSKMIGNKTVQSTSFSKNEGAFSKGSNPFAKNVSYQLQGVSVISTTQLLSLPTSKQVVLMQSYIDRPIMADSPRWYLDPKMKALAKLPPAPNVPDWIVAQREDINDDMLAKLGIDYDPNAEENFEEFEDEEYEEDGSEEN